MRFAPDGPFKAMVHKGGPFFVGFSARRILSAGDLVTCVKG